MMMIMMMTAMAMSLFCSFTSKQCFVLVTVYKFSLPLSRINYVNDSLPQEQIRFTEPQKAFTYRMHNYESIVGPVKGVYSKGNAMNKAREHALLVSDRPAYVTILTLGKLCCFYLL